MAKKNGSAAASAVEPQTETTPVSELNPGVNEPAPIDTLHDDGEVVETAGLIGYPANLSLDRFVNLLQTSQNLQAKQHVISMVPKYREFNAPGETMRGVFLDFTVIEKSEKDEKTGAVIGKKPINCIRWMTDGELYVNGGAALVSTVERLNLPSGTPIEIKYEGKRGQCKLYDVRLVA